MIELPPKALKLFALALNSAAPEGEWQSAAIKGIAVLRTDGYSIEDLQPLSQKAKPTDYEGVMVMPFGKFKGVLINQLPLWYLKWLVAKCELREPLKASIQESLAAAEAVERAEQRQ